MEEELYKLIEKSEKARSDLSETLKSIGIENYELPNSGITLNNKINEIRNELGQENDLWSCMVLQLIQKEMEILNSFKSITDFLRKKYNISEKTSLQKLNFFSKIGLKIRSIFSSKKSLDEQDIEFVNQELNTIRKKDDEIFQYNLKDNIVDAIQEGVNNLEIANDEFLRDNWIQYKCYELEKMGLIDQAQELKKREDGIRQKNSDFREKIKVKDNKLERNETENKAHNENDYNIRNVKVDLDQKDTEK